ncbi:MAG: type II toxin-antitoxin system VapC family toxin [Bauldia sp.]
MLDTNVVSEIRKGERCDLNVRSWYRSVDDTDLYLSVIVLGEIRYGIERVRGREPDRARLFEKWLGELRRYYADRIVPIDERVADAWGRGRVGRTVPTIDALLVATARAHDFVLASRNIADLAETVRIVNPFEPPQPDA